MEHFNFCPPIRLLPFNDGEIPYREDTAPDNDMLMLARSGVNALRPDPAVDAIPA